MKNSNRVIYGLIITAATFLLSVFIGSMLHISNKYIAFSFPGHAMMFLLTCIVIYMLKDYVNYNIALPRFKTIFKPFFLGVATAIIIGIVMAIVKALVGGTIEMHPALAKMSPLQVFINVFFFASIAEEFLFRGFLMNFLKPLNAIGFKVLKIKISLPVIISALLFGLAHLVLIKYKVSILFLVDIVSFTSCLGLVAGYFQEKYNNNAYAIIVHMGGNLMGLLGSILIHYVV